MTLLQTSTIDELCHTLGLRAPYPVAARPNVDALTDEQICALGVLAMPEAIAVVTRFHAQHVIAARGEWLAEHVIEGDAHHLRAAPVDDAPALVLERCGLTDTDDAPVAAYIDVAIAAYRRMQELLRTGDERRARATLVADGARVDVAEAFVAAMTVGITEVAGLGSDGRRFTGCDLAFAGDATTGRWLVPSTHHVDPLPRSAFHHPSLRNVRVLLEQVGSGELADELALIFGGV
jgi:hypothetical protein